MGWINGRQQRRDHGGQREICAADGHPGTADNPLAVSDTGYGVHASHFADPADGFHGRQQK